MNTVLKIEAERPGLRPEKNRPDLAEVIFKGEIDVTRRWNAKVRNLTLHPEIGKLSLDQVFDLLGELCHREHCSPLKIHRSFLTGNYNRNKGKSKTAH
jgi:hypothetical protein